MRRKTTKFVNNFVSEVILQSGRHVMEMTVNFVNDSKKPTSGLERSSSLSRKFMMQQFLFSLLLLEDWNQEVVTR